MKKILLTLCVLLGTVGAWADVLDLTPGNGTYVSSSGNYVNSITFSTTPAITVTASANNMDKRVTETYLQWHSGSAGSSTYTISVGDNYVITAYSVTGEANTSVQTLTAGDVSHDFEVGTSSSFDVTGLNSSSVSFVQTGNNASGLKITSIFVTVVKPTDEQIAAYNIVQGWVPTIQGAKGLVKDAANYISNAQSSAEGSYEALLDGNYDTYFHGAYASQTAPDEDQYLQATLSSAVDAFYFYYKKRKQNNNNRPTSITIYGSNDGSNFTEITTINSGLPTDGNVIDYTSSKISLGASYQYIRFTVTETNNGAKHSNGHVFFTFSEFYILPSDSEVDGVMNLHAALAGTSAINYTAQNISDVTIANTALLSTMVNVTYNLYEADGETLVDTKVVEQEKNSDPANPFTVSSYYDYTISGTIGAVDCIINITRTLKSGVVYPYTNLSNNKCYYIKTLNNARSALSISNGYLASPVKTALGISPKKFAIINYEDNYYLYSVEDSKFVTFSNENEAPLADVITGVSDRVTFSETTIPLYELRFDGSSKKIINSSANYTYGIVINNWGSSSNQWDDGCQYSIEEAEDFDPKDALAVLHEYFHPSYTVTYIVKDAQSNVLFTSEPVGTTNGATITTLPEEYQMAGFYTYNEVNVSITTAGNTKVEFTATPVEKPIVQYTADASNPYYYNLNIRSKYLVYNSEAAGEVTLQDASEPFNPNASWAFIGEPYAGFKVINKTKGTDNFLTYTSVVPGDNHGNNNIQFVATEDFNDQYWLLDKNSGGFVLRMKENKDIYFHHDNGNFLRTCSFAEWAGVHNDVGSTIVASTDEDVLLALYDALSSNHYGDAVGLYHSTSESMTTEDINNSIAEVAEVIQGQKTSDYGDAYKALLEIEKNIAIVAPKPGFYRVKNVFTDGYLKATDATSFSSDVNAVFADAGIDDPATIVELREIDGKLYMINQGAFFNWVIADKSYGSGKAWVAANQDKYVNWLPGSAPGQIAFAICYGNGTGGYASYLLQGIYTANAEGVVVGGNNPAADEAQWVFEEATGVELQLVEVDDYGYATTCLPFDVNKIEGAKPYTVTVKDGWAVLEEVEGDQIPAGLPVVLVGENSDAVICTIGAADAANPSDENVLKGIYLKAIVNGYVLSVSVDIENNDVVGFYKMNSETALSANHAYIPYETVHPDNAEGVKGFALNLGLQDAIERLVSENADGTTYNLAGQRVLKAVKGIFIKNGKKVVK